jgi:hypothetical protein
MVRCYRSCVFSSHTDDRLQRNLQQLINWVLTTHGPRHATRGVHATHRVRETAVGPLPRFRVLYTAIGSYRVRGSQCIKMQFFPCNSCTNTSNNEC